MEDYEIKKQNLWADFKRFTKMFLRTIKPWRMSVIGSQEEKDFARGWNACLLEIRKREVKNFRGMETWMHKIAPHEEGEEDNL